MIVRAPPHPLPPPPSLCSGWGVCEAQTVPGSQSEAPLLLQAPAQPLLLLKSSFPMPFMPAV